MKITVILFIVISFFSISMSVNKEETLLNVPSLEEVNSISKDCPFLLKTIEDNNIGNYTINCGYSEGNVERVTIKIILHQACSMVHNMLLYICENRINITNTTLSLDGEKKKSICPFNFVNFTQPNILNFTRAEKILTNEKYCNQVCYDFDEPKVQCLVLDKINKYLKNLNLVKNSHDKKAGAPSEAAKTEVNISTNFLKTDLKSEGEKINDETWVEKKNMTKGEEETVPAQITPEMPSGVYLDNHIANNKPSLTEETDRRKEESNNHSSIEVEQKFTLSTKSISSKSVSKPSNFKMDESSLKNEDAIKDGEEGEEDHEEQITTDLQKLDASDSENKFRLHQKTSLQDSSIQSEIYSGEGFFQAEDSHFFFYFLMCSSIVVIGYLAFHNKKKIIAFALEGRNGRRIRRRPNPARYRKLESNLEEVIASNDSHTSASSVVY